jgi:hypothetical protein
LKSSIDTTGVQCRRFSEGQIVLFRKGHGFARLHRSQMSQIRLVAHEQLETNEALSGRTMSLVDLAEDLNAVIDVASNDDDDEEEGTESFQ